MSEPEETLVSPIPQGASSTDPAHANSKGIRIAVLGPGPDDCSDPGFQKRQQILHRLAADGHQPFFPEEDGLLASDNPLDPLLNQEQSLLSNPDVHLIIILYTEASIGAGWETANFFANPEIKAKTAVLFPIQFYNPNDNLAANTVRDFLIKLPYTEEHFRVCQLVDECRMWAKSRETGFWPGIVPFVT